MIYLSGAVTSGRHPQVGYMSSPDIGSQIPANAWWAFDNACFAHPDAFDWDRYERALRRRLEQAPGRCLFTVAPDVPFDADGTIKRFEQYRTALGRVPAPVAFVTQDGMGVEDIPWPSIDALFVGGSTEWKLGHESSAIITAARQRRVWVHVGRVNSYRRLAAAASLGADSVDGTFLKYAPRTNWPRLIQWLERHTANPPMLLEGVA